MPEDFRRGMRQLAGAVTIVTAGCDDSAAGLTATAVCSLSAEPPRLLACLNRSGVTFDTVQRIGHFCVNVIGRDDQPIAERFAGMGLAPGENRFDHGDWSHDPARAPRLLSAITAFECRVHSVTMLASHGLVIGDVVHVHTRGDSAPLIYFDGRFSSVG